jgi:hypothetical protein
MQILTIKKYPETKEFKPSRKLDPLISIIKHNPVKKILKILIESKISKKSRLILFICRSAISMNDIRNTNCRMNLGNGWSIMFLSDISPINKNIKE